MTADQAIDVTTLVWAVAALASLCVALPHSVLLIRLWNARDRLWEFRAVVCLLFGALFLTMFRNVAVWADLAWFGQRYLGPIASRWPLDLGLAVLTMIACVWGAFLYARVQREVAP